MSNVETKHDKIARQVHHFYDSLGKNGKPKPGEEWTCLASIVKEYEGSFSVVSLATGTKCIGGNSMAFDGSVVNDSHAEVLARRNFLRYLYDQIEMTLQNKETSVFTKMDHKFVLKSGIEFHFYASQVPCGDASIIPMNTQEKPEESGGKRKRLEDQMLCVKKVKVDVHRTGAKPVKTEVRQDPKGEGAEYHVRGAVRIKPGRGDPTKSLSCSDKIAKWLYCGVEGALLSSLLEDPMKFASIVIGGAGPFDGNVLEEALIGRSGLESSPPICKSVEIFGASADITGASRPCSASINWADVNNKKLEISVDGRRLGVTKKSKAKSYLLISKYALFEQFVRLVQGSPIEGMTYRDAKLKSSEYQARKRQFVQAMGSWSEDKSTYEQFTLSPTTKC